MNARSTWPAALVALSLGCSSGSIGPPAGFQSGGSGAAGSGASGSGASSSGGSGGASTGANSTGSGSVVAQCAIVAGKLDPPNCVPLWRLANAEYANTVHDLLGTDVATIPPLDPDAPSGGFRVGGPASNGTVRSYHDAAVFIASQAVTNLPQLMQSFGCAGAGGPTCFIPAFSQRAFRHVYDAATQMSLQTGLTGVYTKVSTAMGGSATLGIQAVIEDVLQSPFFLYHLEVEEQAKGVGQVAVTNYSIANRLSYLLWASMPDSMALAKAAAGQLSTPAQVQAEASRMVADTKAHIGLRNFYEQWLTVTDMPLTKSGNFAALYTPDVQASLRASFDAQVDDALWATTGAAKALLSGSQGYVNAAIAPIFGATGVTGTALQKVTLDPAQRAGIVTHPALMATYAIDTASHPIKRGRFMWEQFLCEPFPDPPVTTPIGAPTFVAPMPNQSLRQDFEVLTRGTLPPNPPEPGHQTYCMSCHSKLNPVGFLFENYDTMGKYRTIDDYNQPVKTSDLVVAGDPTMALNGPTTSATQFAANLANNHGQVANCMTTQLFRYMAKRDDGPNDAAAIAGLQSSFTASQESVGALLAALTQADVFLYRMNVQ